MPQISLEYTSNINPKIPTAQVTTGLHRIVSEVLGVDVENCKTRVVVHGDFCVGTGGDSKSFVHAEVGILSGRPRETKSELGLKLVGYLQRCFSGSTRECDAQITVEIRDMDREAYFKAARPGLHRESN
jgi:5-carboxymethyl-2-hydroxymuconate isomerase